MRATEQVEADIDSSGAVRSSPGGGLADQVSHQQRQQATGHGAVLRVQRAHRDRMINTRPASCAVLNWKPAINHHQVESLPWPGFSLH